MKIRTVNRGHIQFPVYGIVARPAPYRHGAPVEVVAAYGKTVYSPRHHLDAEGRPIPARRNGRGGYEPSTKPATILEPDALVRPRAGA